MAGNVLGCNLDDVKAAAACFMPQCMGQVDIQSIQILIRVHWLAAAGGPDYIDDLAALDSAAVQWSTLAEQQWAPSEWRAIDTWIDLQFALDAGATFGGDTSAKNLKELAACYRCIGESRRKGIILFLKCEIAS